MSADDDRWARVKALFADALERPPHERAAFVRAASGDDRTLCEDVEALLEEHEAAGPFDEVVDELRSLMGSALRLRPGDRIGRFRIIRELGEGGMGTVYLAERADADFELRVAIKVVAPGLAMGELGHRLRDERRILAALDHAAIARFLDGDVTPGGHPYLVMEYVEGRPIDAFADAHRLDVDERLALFAQVVEAVQYAHAHLILHQDIKPSNVLVRPDGSVKLLDFGVARLLGDRSAAEAGSPGGHTPGYASPEQLRGDPTTLSSDVHALGVLLHVLLTGRGPSRPAAPPSVADLPAGAAADRSTTARRLRARLSGDLDAIVLRALAVDPSARYATAEQLAIDLRALAEARPVAARGGGRRYRAARFVRRNRLAVGAAVALGVALLGGLVATAVQARRAATQARIAANERDLSRQISELLIGMFELSDPSVARGETITAREILDRAAADVDQRLAGRPATRARMLFEIARVYHNLGLAERASDVAGRSVAAYRSLRAPSVESTEALRLLATLETESGRAEAAVLLIDEALPTLRAQLPDTRATLAATLNDRAIALRALTRHQAAEADLLEALALTDDGDPRSLVAEIVYGLALARHDQADFAGAEARFREAVALLPMGETEGGDALVAARARQQLAQLLMIGGRTDEAETVLRDALSLQDAVLEPDHPDRITTLKSLATVKVNTRRYDEAVELLKQALAAQERAGLEGVSVDQTRYILGTALLAIGREAESARLLTTVVRHYRETYGATHPYVHRPAYVLSRALLAVGDLDGAEQAAQASADAVRASFSEEHPFAAESRTQLARVALARGRVGDAVELATRATEMALRTSGPDDRITVGARVVLGRAFLASSEPGRALEPLAAAARTIDALEQEPRGPLFSDAHLGLGRALAAAGRPKEAIPELHAALAARERLLPAGHPRVEEARAALHAVEASGPS